MIGASRWDVVDYRTSFNLQNISQHDKKILCGPGLSLLHGTCKYSIIGRIADCLCSTARNRGHVEAEAGRPLIILELLLNCWDMGGRRERGIASQLG